MSHFAKRHYEAIATVMQTAHPGESHSSDHATKEYFAGLEVQWKETCKDLAEMFERDNPQFDIIRFMHACKPGNNVRARKAA